MGLFSQRPEEPTEWAGLPSEPARVESSADRLPEAAPVDLGDLGVAALGGGGVEAIVIPLTPVTPVTPVMPVAEVDPDVEPEAND
jgi:hypothetical protein